MAGYLHHYLNQIGDLIRDPAMIEIALNGDGRIWTERAGQAVMQEASLPGLEAHFARDLAKQIAKDQSLSLNDIAPMVSASVEFEGVNLRCQVIVPPASATGTVISLRLFRPRTAGAAPHRFGLLRDVKHSMEEERASILGRLKAELTIGSEDEFDAFCREVVGQRLNVLISGITSGGKTELSRRLLWMVAPDQRLALIQDANELLPDLPNVVNLIADRKETSPRSADRLLEATLRLRPDRIILGELRGVGARPRLEPDEGDGHLPGPRVRRRDAGRGEDVGVLREEHLDLGGEDAHAVDLDHLLGAGEVRQGALVVEAPCVAGAQPAVDERVLSRAGILPIPGRHRG